LKKGGVEKKWVFTRKETVHGGNRDDNYKKVGDKNEQKKKTSDAQIPSEGECA